MFSLWGNLSEAVAPGKNEQNRYYYATSSGQILSADGSGYVLPDMGKYSPEQTQYIPKEVAMDKVKEVLDEAKVVRQTYEDNLEKVETFYKSAVQQSKDHYESIIQELKNKALRHVEVQRLLKQQMEDKLTKELQQSEQELEELRDTMATRNLQYKEEVRGLKAKISDSEHEIIGLKKSIEEESTRFQVSLALNHTVGLVEKRSDEEEKVEHFRAINKQIEENLETFDAAIKAERQASEEAVSQLLNDYQDRQQCQSVLQDVLTTIELNDYRQTIQTALDTKMMISELQEKVQEHEMEIAQKSGAIAQLHEELDSLGVQKTDLLKQLEEINASHAQQLEALASERNEAIAHLKSKVNSILKEMKHSRDRAEVEVALLEIKEQVYERTIQSMADEKTILANSSAESSSKVLAEEKASYGAMLKQLEDDHAARIKTMKIEMKKALDRVKGENQRLVVRMSLEKLISAVVERNMPQQQVVVQAAAVNAESATVPATAVPADIVNELNSLRAQLEEAKRQIALQKEQQGPANEVATPVVNAGETAVVAPMEAPKGDQSAPDEPVVKPIVIPPSSLSEEEEQTLKRLKARLRELDEAIQSRQSEVDNVTNTLAPVVQEREAVKVEIKVWTKEFKDANGREPEVADKAQIRDKYQKYKVTSTRSKELEVKLEELKVQLPPLVTEREEVHKELTVLKEKRKSMEQEHKKAVEMKRQQSIKLAGGPDSLQGMKIVPEVEVKDQDVQVNVSELRLQSMQSMRMKPAVSAPSSPRQPAAAAGGSGESEADQLRTELNETQKHYEEIVEQLEDSLFAVREQLTTIQSEHTILVGQKQIMERELAELIQAKRTDVIKRMEDDLHRLTESEASLSEKVTNLSTEKIKLEAKVKELKERAERAEQDLRDRDARDIAAMSPQDEKAILNKELLKQRDTAIQKAKAATAGWDAAANADEKLDLEIQKSYQRGIREERDRHANDLVATNKALEAKEQRITDLLVSMAEMEKKMHANEIEKEKMKVAMDNMKLEVADAIAAIDMVGNAANKGGGEGGDSEAAIGPSEAELDAAREQLDQAQEELVSLQERCDRLESELELARKKNRIYDRYAAVNGLGDMAGGGGASMPQGGGGGSESSRYSLDDAIAEVKKAILKGTNLWKSNRKDDCYDVYLDACNAAAQRVYTDDLAKPLRDCIEHGRAVGAMNKQKGAIFFRKGLDKFMADVSSPTAPLRKAEDDAVAGLRAKESADASNSAMNKSNTVAHLVNELTALDDSMLAQGYTRENNPTVAPTSPRGEEKDKAEKESASSLFQRAKAAEAQVVSLKKQMAAIIAATAANTAAVVYVEAPAGGAAAAAAGNGAMAPVAGAAIVPVAGAGAVVGTTAIRAAAAGGNDGKSAAEVRKLQRKIKDLEAEIAKLNASGGGGASSAEVKALQQNEKVLQKKLKDADAALKRETKSLEMRATKAENALQKIQSTYDGVVSERDTLRSENNKLITATKEIAELRQKAEAVVTLEETLKARDEELSLLQDQFKKESQLRKKYKNELEDLKGAIRVYARCRPMAQYEIQRGSKQVVQIKDDTSMKVTTSRGEKEFEFDAVFGPTSTQDQVFEDTKRLVESCLDGFNVCVFAYGQTGSGKTHTMTGNPSNPGLTPKAVEELFRLIAEKKHCQCKVSTYFIELYNDNLVDLYWILDNAKVKGPPQEPPKLDIKLDAKKMVTIRNSVIKDVSSPDELMNLFNLGNAERHTGATKMNAESSRSHSVFAM